MRPQGFLAGGVIRGGSGPSGGRGVKGVGTARVGHPWRAIDVVLHRRFALARFGPDGYRHDGGTSRYSELATELVFNDKTPAQSVHIWEPPIACPNGRAPSIWCSLQRCCRDALSSAMVRAIPLQKMMM